jgi:hypothetical protein
MTLKKIRIKKMNKIRKLTGVSLPESRKLVKGIESVVGFNLRAEMLELGAEIVSEAPAYCDDDGDLYFGNVVMKRGNKLFSLDGGCCHYYFADLIGIR